jgi:hypothetical protein
MAREAEIDRGRSNALLSALEEEIRHRLCQAAYLDVALGAADGMFGGQADGPSDQSLRHLRRHGYPFAGALRAVDMSGVTLRADAAAYMSLLSQNQVTLQRRFEGAKQRIAEALHQRAQLMKDRHSNNPISLEVEWYT